MKNIIFIILTLFLVTSCEKEIDLDLDDKSGNIVIEGNVTNQPGPYFVRITKSVAFTENNHYPAVSDAQVILSDNTGQTETLQYVGDGKYKTTAFTGVTGRTYTLTIQAEGKQYTAQSSMPEVVNFDGLTQDSFAFGGETTYTLLPVFTDPIALGNRYLFNFTVNNMTKKTFEVFSDNVNNGLVNQRPFFLPNEDDDDDPTSHKVVPGDTIYVEMQSIEHSIFTYYSALLQISGDGGAGVTPSNPPSNINNGALGYFSAHTTQKKSIVIQ
ncbi:DUF4249 domain-containing protein [Chryseobacterium vrystaatense]|uniref:DUF4249 domain-containing protein n=1 Tax=Chryseobacterium vrystaatense TaxID=307480 RepID=A0ABR4UFX7_9FLAO|nr:DUF4249 domain-containing protein [Chryseobacterium vrystaatense]KFF23387.1 hypothetical protein IW16_24255 [Chryseobacterium vrystaatense]